MSASFWKWFGDSAVVHEDGDPLVVYHGTFADFEEFRYVPGAHLGFHFGSIEQAERIGRSRTGREIRGRGMFKVIPAYLSIENPLRLRDVGDWSNPYAVWDAARKKVPALDNDATMRLMISDRAKKTRLNAIRDAIMEDGYDGIVYKNRIEGRGESYIAFYPEQIRRADIGVGEPE